MVVNGSLGKKVRFGVFELDLDSGELRKHGVRLRLQTKPFQVLQALLERPGDVVTREELRQRLWPDGAERDVEGSLNTAANRLRLVLGDSAEQARYIETLNRVGYRFIAPVEWVRTEAVPPPETGPPAPDPPAGVSEEERRAPRRRRWKWVAVIAAATALLVLTLAPWRRDTGSQTPEFRQVTFQRGTVWSARFGADGKSAFYTASWEGSPQRIYQLDLASAASTPLDSSSGLVTAVAKNGDLAILSDSPLLLSQSKLATHSGLVKPYLVRIPLDGGPARLLAEQISAADYMPEGEGLAVIRGVERGMQLECPPGTPIHKTTGWLSHLRIAPDGRRVAFIEHPTLRDDAGQIMVANLDGEVRVLSAKWGTSGGLAWHPSGNEVWFTAARQGIQRSLWAVTLDGTLRPLLQVPGTLTIRDISADGRALISRDSLRMEMMGRFGANTAQRPISWMDFSAAQDISPDGRLVLFYESGEGAGASYKIFVHRVEDGQTLEAGQGRAFGFSPDARWVVAAEKLDSRRLTLFPVAGGEPKQLPETGLLYQSAQFFPDGQRLLVYGHEDGGPLRLYIQRLEPGEGEHPIEPLGKPIMARKAVLSPDGWNIAVLNQGGELLLVAVNSAPDGEPVVVETDGPLLPIRWTQDGQSLLVARQKNQMPLEIFRMSLPDGKLTPWGEVAPPDRVGVSAIGWVQIAADEESYAYSYARLLSELFIAQWP
jgi:eukaryotic-like serine/threonine-protein kinase